MTNRAGLLLIVLLGSVGLIAWLVGPQASSDVGIAEPPRGSHDSELPRRADPSSSEASTPDPQEPPAEEAAEESVRRRITVTGRCIAATNRTPLSGCEVTVTATPPLSEPPDEAAEPPVLTATVHTDSAGRFSAQVELPREHRVSISTRMDGRAAVRGTLPELPMTVEPIDVGDISIPLGTWLQAHLVDDSGLPMPGVRVRFERAVTGEPRTLQSQNVVSVESDASGTLVIDEPMACGTWAIQVPEHLELLRPVGHLEIGAGHAVQQATIVLLPPDPKTIIAGRVVDALGSPAPSVQVRAEDQDARPAGTAETNERGEFRVVRDGDTEGPVHLRIYRAAGFDDLVEPWSYEWGSLDVVLTLQHAGSVIVTVVEAGTARPVEDFGVSWFQVDDSEGSLYGSHGTVGHHAGGEATVEGVPRGKIRMVVTPASAALAPSDPIEFLNGARQAAVRVELKRRRDLLVHVAFGDGRPAAGSKLELMRPPANERISLTTYGLDSSRHAQLVEADSYALLLDDATTDEAGNAVLQWPACSTSLAIRVRGPGHLPVVEHGIVASGHGHPIEIIVSPGATFSGVVRPLSVLRALGRGQLESHSGVQGPTMVLTYIGNQEGSGTYPRRTQRLDGTGEFQFTGLQPGTWSVMFRDLSFDPRRTSNLTSEHFAPVVLGPDTHLRAEYDIGHLAPATLEGQVVLDGNPVANQRIELVRVSTADDAQFVQAGSSSVVTDSAGNFSAEGIHPGRYHAAIPALIRGGRPHGRLMCPEAVDVAPGSEASRVFYIQSGKLEIRLTDESGEPVARRHFVVHNERTGFRITQESDAEGVLRSDPIAAGMYTISVDRLDLGGPHSSGDRLRSLGEVVVASGPAVSKFAITVPED